jgi:hypothetical protein
VPCLPPLTACRKHIQHLQIAFHATRCQPQSNTGAYLSTPHRSALTPTGRLIGSQADIHSRDIDTMSCQQLIHLLVVCGASLPLNVPSLTVQTYTLGWLHEGCAAVFQIGAHLREAQRRSTTLHTHLAVLAPAHHSDGRRYCIKGSIGSRELWQQHPHSRTQPVAQHLLLADH